MCKNQNYVSQSSSPVSGRPRRGSVVSTEPSLKCTELSNSNTLIEQSDQDSQIKIFYLKKITVVMCERKKSKVCERGKGIVKVDNLSGFFYHNCFKLQLFSRTETPCISKILYLSWSLPFQCLYLNIIIFLYLVHALLYKSLINNCQIPSVLQLRD